MSNIDQLFFGKETISLLIGKDFLNGRLNLAWWCLLSIAVGLISEKIEAPSSLQAYVDQSIRWLAFLSKVLNEKAVIVC